MAYTKYSLTPSSNTAAPPDGAPEGMLPSAVNDTMRDMMAQIRDCGDGIRDGTYTMTAPKITGGTITGSTINNSAIGATTATTGKFTTLEATGVATFSAGAVGTPAITTTGDTNTGIFFPAADTIAFTEGGAEAMRIDSDGDVGIGTSSPAYKLDVQGTANSTLVSLGTARPFRISAASDGTNDDAIWNLNATSSVGQLRFSTNNTERMRIDQSGNVGIGTSSPTSRFHVASSSDPTITLQNTTGGESTLTLVAGGNSSIRTTAGLTFVTNGTERMRITSAGDVLVGATATSNNAKFFVSASVADRFIRFNNSQPSAPFGIVVEYTAAAPNDTGKSFLFCADNSATRADIRSNGGLANYSANNVNLSDAREKTNVELAGSYLDKICAIPVKTFNYIDQNREEDDGLTLGVIAQDVQAVAPELVTESDWGTENNPKMRLSIYQTDLQYALMKAIQELKAELDSVKAELQTLKGV